MFRENFPGPEIFSIGSPKIGNYDHIFFNPYNPSVSLCVCSLEKAGFKDVIVTGCQRYPLANHLHWLSKNQPGGHQKWNFLRTIELDSAYSKMLGQLDKNDTIIATATKA